MAKLCTRVLVQKAGWNAYKTAVSATRLFKPMECTREDGKRTNGVGNERSTEGGRN